LARTCKPVYRSIGGCDPSLDAEFLAQGRPRALRDDSWPGATPAIRKLRSIGLVHGRERGIADWRGGDHRLALKPSDHRRMAIVLAACLRRGLRQASIRDIVRS